MICTSQYSDYKVLTVTVANRPSGTLATIIPMRKMTASSKSYWSASPTMKKETPRTTATMVIRWIKWDISIPIGVSDVCKGERKDRVI